MSFFVAAQTANRWVDGWGFLTIRPSTSRSFVLSFPHLFDGLFALSFGRAIIVG
jgi:hypothetical protein